MNYMNLFGRQLIRHRLCPFGSATAAEPMEVESWPICEVDYIKQLQKQTFKATPGFWIRCISIHRISGNTLYVTYPLRQCKPACLFI